MELKLYLAIVWRWLWLILLCVLLAGGAAFLFSRQQTPIFQARSLVLLDNSRATTANVAYQDILVGERLARTYAELFRGRAARERVIQELGTLPDRLSISATPQSDTTLLTVVVESESAEVAAFVANTLPGIVGEQQRQRQAQRFAEAKSSLQAEADTLAREIEGTRTQLSRLSESASEGAATATDEVARLEATLSLQEATYQSVLRDLSNIRLAEAQEADTLALVESARVPERPVRPRPLTNTLLAAVVGAMVGLGVAFLIEYLDDTIKPTSDLAALLGTGVLAIMGRADGSADRSPVAASDRRSPLVESYRMLRTNIRFASVDERFRSLLITSPGPGEGKSTTAANLAVVMAQAGQSTILVDADLRRPMVHKIFNFPNRAGLTTALVERDSAVESYLHRTATDGLRVLTTGPIPPNPAELLGSQRMQELLHELEQLADTVVLDSAPVLAAADSSLLAGSAGAVLVVLRANQTRIEAAQRALEQLHGVHANVIGVGLNDVESGREGYYYYYYYQNYYGSEDDPGSGSSPDGHADPPRAKRGASGQQSPSLLARLRAMLM